MGKIKRISISVLLVLLSATFLESLNVLLLPEIQLAHATLTSGLPTADVYIVYNSTGSNYATINGSNLALLQTNSNPVTAINNAISHTGPTWLPTNGKLVTNGTMANWNGVVLPTHGSFKWEAWKTVATQSGSGLQGIYLDGYIYTVSHVSINNFTYYSTASSLFAIEGNQLGTDVNVTHCKVYMTSDYGTAIALNGGSYCNIKYNTVNYTGTGAWSLAFNVATYSTIANNTCNINGNGGGIGDWSTGASGITCHNTIANNTIRNWGSPSGQQHGIYVGEENYDTISYNQISTTVTGSLGNGAGILIKSSRDYVCGNNITTAGGSGGYGHNGIVLYNQTVAPTYTNLRNNTITTTGSDFEAIRIGGQSSFTTDCSNEYFYNCTVKGNWGVDVLIENPVSTPQNTNITFYGCHFLNGHSAFQIGYPPDSHQYISNVTIRNCVFNTFDALSGSTTSGSQSRHTEIFVYSSAINTIIRDNTFIACSTPSYPIISSDSTSTLIYNNTGLTGFKTLAVSVVGSGTTTPYGSGWQYLSGATVSVIWTPTGGYSRINFAINGVNQTSTTSPINVIMSVNVVAVAYFSGTSKASPYLVLGSFSPVVVGSSNPMSVNVVGGSSPTGHVYWTSNNSVYVQFGSSSSIVSGGVASTTILCSRSGVYVIFANYTGDANNNGYYGSFTITIYRIASQTSWIVVHNFMTAGLQYPNWQVQVSGYNPTGYVLWSCTNTSLSWTYTNVTLTGSYASSQLYVATVAGTYLLSAAYSGDRNNNASSVAFTLTVVPVGLLVNISASVTQAYAGTPITFTSTVVGGQAPYYYQWYINSSAASGATGSSFAMTPNSSGSYQVYLIVVDGKGVTVKSPETYYVDRADKIVSVSSSQKDLQGSIIKDSALLASVCLVCVVSAMLYSRVNFRRKTIMKNSKCLNQHRRFGL